MGLVALEPDQKCGSSVVNLLAPGARGSIPTLPVRKSFHVRTCFP